MRGRWLTSPYTDLRNAAWAVRNSRVGASFNPLALRLVLVESKQLLTAGEDLLGVLEAYAELLMRLERARSALLGRVYQVRNCEDLRPVVGTDGKKC